MDNQNVYDSLFSAVRAGRLEKAKELINIVGVSRGYVLLCIALRRKHVAVAKLLLTSGSTVNDINEEPANTPLHLAVMNFNIEIVKMILDKGGNVDAKNQYGRPPLHYAIENGIIQLTELLLMHGTDVNYVCSSTKTKGYGPLHFAVEKGSKEIVELLVRKGANVNVKAEGNITPLHIAAKKGYIQIAEDLLNHGAFVHSVTLKEYTPLHFASKIGNEELVKLFLNRGADINASTTNNVTSLHIAITMGHKTVVRLLLQHGANVDNQDKDGKTALHLAVKKGCFMIVKDILKYSPDVNNPSNRRCLEIAVCGYGEEYKDIVAALLEYGFIVNHEDANKTTLLLVAVEKGYLKIVEHFLKYGADVNMLHNSKFIKGFTLLHSAVKNKEEGVAKLLISSGADINVQDGSGNTPIFYAIENTDLKITKLLLSNGANIKGSTKLLNIAAQKNCIKIIEALLQHGADINSRDEYGKTALHITSEEGHSEVVVTLLEHGSDINIRSKFSQTPLDHARAGAVEILKRHIVKMKTANLYVCEQNLLSLGSSDESDFKDKCNEEIASMQREKINNANISLYDVLAKGTNSLAMCMRNENIVQVLKSNDYKTKFPIYASMIGINFKKGMVRKELLEQGIIIFQFLFNNCPELPHHCIEKIFSYLSDADLRILIDFEILY